MADTPKKSTSVYKYSGFLMGLSLFFLTLSGMTQMPISKRYYLSDIPGFSWLADFYVTHYIHYMSAFVFIVLIMYFITDYLFNKKDRVRITLFGLFRISFLAILLVSGIIMVIKNFDIYIMDSSGIVLLNLVHLGIAMLVMAQVVFKKIFKLNYWKL